MYRKKMVNRNGTLGDIDTDASTFDILVFKMWSLSIKYRLKTPNTFISVQR